MKEPINITFDWLNENNYPSVTDFCRYLVSTGGKFDGVKINIYRREMLCYIVNNIEEAAKVIPVDCRWKKYNSKYRKRG